MRQIMYQDFRGAHPFIEYHNRYDYFVTILAICFEDLYIRWHLVIVGQADEL